MPRDQADRKWMSTARRGEAGITLEHAGKHGEERASAQNIESIITSIVGRRGRFQRDLFIFLCASSLLSAWNGMMMPFAAPVVDYWCVGSDNGRTMGGSDHNNTCDWQGKPCTRWNYDVGMNTSMFKRTVISQYNLVCDREWLASLSQSIYMFGMLSATFVMSHFSDRYGRRPVIITGLIFNLLGNIGVLCSPTIYHFIVSRYLTAFGGATHWSTGFVLMTEITTSRYRKIIGVSVQFGWALGYMTVPLIFYVFQDYLYFMLVCIVFQIIQCVLYFRVIVESPRWLLVRNRREKAISVMRYVLAYNGDREADNLGYLTQELGSCDELGGGGAEEHRRRYTFVDLFSTKKMFKFTMITYFLWLTNNLVYYGLSFNSSALTHSVYMNYMVLSAVEMPAYAFAFFITDKLHIKPCLSYLLLASSIGCFGTMVIAYSHTAGIAMAMLGKLCVTSSFALIYVFTASLYPTVLRSIGLGTSSMVGKTGSLFSPFIKELIALTHLNVPLAIFGSMALVSSALVRCLPAKHMDQLPDRIKDIAGDDRAEEEDKSDASLVIQTREESDDSITVEQPLIPQRALTEHLNHNQA